MNASNKSSITSGNVTGSEGYDELLRFRALVPRLGHHELVESLNSSLEAGELHHGVGNLPSPQGHKGLVESVDALSLVDLGDRLPQFGGECSDWAGLHPDLGRLHGRKGNVSEELRRSRGSQVQGGAVEEGVLFADHVAVHVLEHLIEAELADALGGVADGGRGPTEEKAGGTALLHGNLEAGAEALVLLFVDLQTAFHQIEGGDSGVGDAAREKATESAECVILGVADLARVAFIRGCGNQSPLFNGGSGFDLSSYDLHFRIYRKQS